ncbi:MAG TPA: 16S rRNA (cytosine(967)-C(5))-methyltransferase RsmB [Steroidobacteraceae bacterium]|nr:16S rRNA (cytosine(967)-C(5))-methyltransferase RsmB [Steroidobacteraceae bacterium]
MARTRWAPGASALAGAARIVEAVASDGRSADAALGASDPGEDRAALRAIGLGTLRWYLRLMPAVESLLERPSGIPAPIRGLLVVASHQIEYSRNVPEQTVHAAVDAARILGRERSTGLVNAVLRRYLSEHRDLLERVDLDLAARTAHPRWLVDRLGAAWGDRCTAILEANNIHPPMTLRVDMSRSNADERMRALESAGIESFKVQWIDSAITLKRPTTIDQLPGFADGLVSVQDAGAQLAADLLDLKPGMRVLDACAAPGGKTGHILERLGDGADVTAVDVDAERLELIRENLGRLRRTAHLAVADARDPESFPAGRAYDRILVDAPCSSTGVIRRHPDIKLLRRASDLPGFIAAQVAILKAASRVLAPGGRLVYSTCSVLPEENEQVIQRFLSDAPGMAVAKIPRAAELTPGALDRRIGVQLLPGAEAGTDGFYYACVEKTTAGT